MKLIIADNASVLPGRSELWSGSEEEDYRFQRKWIIPCAPKLELDKGAPASEWSTVTKLLDGISWDLHLTLRLRNTTDVNSQAANIKAIAGFGHVKKFTGLFIGLFWRVKREMKIVTGVGESRCVTFKGIWHASESGSGSQHDDEYYDSKLTVEEVFHLLMANDNNIRVSYAYEIELLNKDHSAKAVCKKILETGDFADMEVVSTEGTAIPCHRVFFNKGSGDFKKKIEGGASSVKVNLSERVVRVLLGYLYHGDLDQIKDDLELAVEVLEANGSYNVPNLWKEITGMFMEKDLDAKIAFALFSTLVKAGKVDDFEDLARKLVTVIHLNSGQVAGDSGAFMDYFKDQAFVTALYKMVSIVVRVEGIPPTKQARLHK